MLGPSRRPTPFRQPGRRSTSLGLILLLLSSLVAPIAAAAPDPASNAAMPRLQVAVSTPVLAEIVARTAGPAVSVWSVVPAGGDPHAYEAVPQDLERIEDADLYVEMGANLERYAEAGAWRRAVLEAGVPVLRLADHLDLIVKDVVIDHGDHVHDLRAGDPHVWLDPAYVRTMSGLVRDEVIRLAPDLAAEVTASAAAWDAELAALELELDAAFAAIPDANRKLVVLHDAFAYLARRYDLEVIGFVTTSHGQEPSAADVAELIEIVRSSGVPAVFTEPQMPDAILWMVAQETGVAVGLLLSDTFTAEVDSYVELMRHDAAEISRLLG